MQEPHAGFQVCFTNTLLELVSLVISVSETFVIQIYFQILNSCIDTVFRNVVYIKTEVAKSSFWIIFLSCQSVTFFLFCVCYCTQVDWGRGTVFWFVILECSCK